MDDYEVLELHDGTMLRIHSEANCPSELCPIHKDKEEEND